MSLITRKIVEAFEQRRALRISNSETDGYGLFLFNNKIAAWRSDGLWITNAGWFSKTTKERLNGLTGVNIRQERGEWYLNGVRWTGEWINVGTMTTQVGQILSTEPEIEQEPIIEFDLTSEWTDKGYSKPIYSVFHSKDVDDLDAIEFKLNSAGINHRRVESDTAGCYSPNYFIVVRPEDFDNSLIIIK